MENVLIIANQFPPMGGSGVQRTSKFVKYLPSCGYSPVVLTRDCENLALTDATLLSDIAAETPVIRTKSHDYTNLSGILRIPGKVYARKILIPDAERIWAENSINPAMEAIKKHGIKIIYSTSYPYSDHLLAMKIKKRLPGIKWVADFRDEWTNNPYRLDNPHNPLRRSIEKRMEREVLNTADALVSNTPIMVKNFIDLSGISGGNFHCIPNGYDEDDFAGITEKTEKAAQFTLTYTGALYGRRKPDTFFRALSSLISDGEVKKGSVSVNLIGNYSEGRLRADIERHGLIGVVNIIPYMPHGESIRALASSECLLLIEGSGRGAEAFYTGKIFEYMMAKAPVLAIIPKNGAAASLIKSTNVGNVCDFDDIAEIKRGFMLYYKLWEKGEGNYAPDYGEIAKYARKALTKRLASIFDGLLNINGN